jgi:hypothetical protein
MQAGATGLRRAGIVAVATALTLAFAAAPTNAAEKKKVASEVDIDGWDYQPPLYEINIIGNVYSKRPKCVRNRSVTLFLGGVGGEAVGSTTTDSTGDWRTVPEALVAGGEYQAEVAKKRVRKQDKKIVCQADTSPTFILPP